MDDMSQLPPNEPIYVPMLTYKSEHSPAIRLYLFVKFA